MSTPSETLNAVDIELLRDFLLHGRMFSDEWLKLINLTCDAALDRAQARRELEEAKRVIDGLRITGTVRVETEAQHALVSAQAENERLRIALEMHDEIEKRTNARADSLAALVKQLQLEQDTAIERADSLARELETIKDLYEAGKRHWNPVYEIVLNERDKLKAELETIRAIHADWNMNADVTDLMAMIRIDAALQPRGEHE